MSFDWKSLLKGVAPIAAGLLGGPLAGVAVKELVSAFDPSGKTDPTDASAVDKLMTGVVMDPTSIVKIKEIEANLAAHMADLGMKSAEDINTYNLDQERLSVEDRDSARKRQTTLKDWTPTVLAGGVTLGFFGLLGFMLKHDIPAANKDVLNIMLGSLGGAWVSIIAYYFGSSKGSADKTTLLAKAPPVKD